MTKTPPEHRAYAAWCHFKSEFQARITDVWPALTDREIAKLENKIKKELQMFALGYDSDDRRGRFVDLCRYLCRDLKYKTGSPFWATQYGRIVYGTPIEQPKPPRKARKLPRTNVRKRSWLQHDVSNIQAQWLLFYEEVLDRCDTIRPILKKYARAQLINQVKWAMADIQRGGGTDAQIIDAGRAAFAGVRYRSDTPWAKGHIPTWARRAVLASEPAPTPPESTPQPPTDSPFGRTY